MNDLNHIQECYKAEPVARVGLDINQDGEGNPVLTTFDNLWTRNHDILMDFEIVDGQPNRPHVIIKHVESMDSEGKYLGSSYTH